MILLDVNVVVAAFWDDHEHHPVVRGWLTGLSRRSEPFGVPMMGWASVLRLTTSRRVVRRPAAPGDVFRFVDAVLAQANYRSIDPGPQHLSILERLCSDSDVSGDLVPDAILAAIAIESGAAVASFDRDFARFPSLRWVIPGAVAQP
jgi:toxin-antitoxin system PIN domain toxin